MEKMWSYSNGICPEEPAQVHDKRHSKQPESGLDMNLYLQNTKLECYWSTEKVISVSRILDLSGKYCFSLSVF